MSDYSGVRALVVGLAGSGQAAAELLVSRGASVTVTDLQPESELRERAQRLRSIGVDLELGGHRRASFESAQLVVVSPGVPFDHPDLAAARSAGAEVIGELELGFREIRGRVLAVTGSKGKSTTTSALGAMLREAGFEVRVGGNLGEAVSGLVHEHSQETRFVLEVSSFQLEASSSFHPQVAVFLNLSADHLERHGHLEAYARAKARIFSNQTPEDWAVVGSDEPRVLALALSGRARVAGVSSRDESRPAGLQGRASFEAGKAIWRGPSGTELLFERSDVRLRGEHLASDLLSAATAALLSGATPEAIRRAVKSFQGLPHVLEPAGEIGGVRFFNDTKATNVDAVEKSLEAFDGPVVAILGGRYKGGDFGKLREHALPGSRGGRLKAVMAIGEATPLIDQALGRLVPVVCCEDMADAVASGLAAADPGEVVLLAPGCSSFDMFRDYAARGEAFKSAVAALASRLSRPPLRAEA